jgi:hypothetical protein
MYGLLDFDDPGPELLGSRCECIVWIVEIRRECLSTGGRAEEKIHEHLLHSGFGGNNKCL